MRCRIVGATLRDLSYIGANLRPDDYREIDCQLDEWNPTFLAAISMRGLAWVAELDGNPEAAFGAHEHRKGLWIVWSWGTRKIGRCIPTITHFATTQMMPFVLSQGALRGEARAIADNQLAHRWLERLGARRQGLLESYGKNGEDFILYEWVRSQFDGDEHVPSNASSPAPAPDPAICE